VQLFPPVRPTRRKETKVRSTDGILVSSYQCGKAIRLLAIHTISVTKYFFTISDS